MRPKISVKILTTPQQTVKEFVREFGNCSFIIYFAPCDSFKEITNAFYSEFSKATLIGASSHYIYDKDGMNVNSIGAVAFYKENVDVEANVISKIKENPLPFATRIKDASEKISHENTICLEFTPGATQKEENILKIFSSVCKNLNIPVLGGTAGLHPRDNRGNIETYVAFNGKSYNDSSVFCFIHNKNGKIGIFKENIYVPTEKKFIATDVNTEKRILYKLDDKDALEVLTKALDCSKFEIGTELNTHPLVRKLENNDLYLTDFYRILPTGETIWHSGIIQGTELILTKPGDYRKITSDTFKKIHHEFPDPSFLLYIQCISRTLFFEKEKYLGEYSRNFGKEFPVSLGFSSLGEQLNETHFNQTMIALVFE
ncbi:MAG: hypothetical protein K5839_03350 [Treponemataceae bacterium]|nr:hypothetical protein [Treponemataceae bacterium]